MAAAVICTDQFISSARMTAQTFGMHNYPFAIIPHPLGSLTDAELQQRALLALPQVLDLLKPASTAV